MKTTTVDQLLCTDIIISPVTTQRGSHLSHLRVSLNWEIPACAMVVSATFPTYLDLMTSLKMLILIKSCSLKLILIKRPSYLSWYLSLQYERNCSVVRDLIQIYDFLVLLLDPFHLFQRDWKSVKLMNKLRVIFSFLFCKCQHMKNTDICSNFL